MAFVVTQGTREIAIRMALGVSVQDVRRMVGAGRAPGVGRRAPGRRAGAALATLLHGLVVGVAAVDPVSNGAAAALFAGVLAVACRRLTTRAATTDPAVALHAQ